MIDNSGTRHARSCIIAATERPRTGSKQMATYQAVAQTQSSCLIAARARSRAGSKQMATYQAVAQTQSSSSSSQLCCSVATQTWSAHVARSLLHTIQCVSMNCCCIAHTYRAKTPNCAAATAAVHIFSHTQQQHACCTSFSASMFPTFV